MLKNKDLNLIVKLLKEKSDDNCIIKNKTLGKVVFPYGILGNTTDINKLFTYGFGLVHIVQSRYERDSLNQKEIAALLIIIYEAILTQPLILQSNTRFIVDYRGVRVSVDKNWFGKKESWIITGFPLMDELKGIKKEAMDTIEAVNANYCYNSQFSCIQTEIGAIIASINSIRKRLTEINKKETKDTFNKINKHTK